MLKLSISLWFAAPRLQPGLASARGVACSTAADNASVQPAAARCRRTTLLQPLTLILVFFFCQS